MRLDRTGVRYAIGRATNPSCTFASLAYKFAVALTCTIGFVGADGNAAIMRVVPGSDSEPALIIIEGEIEKGDDAKFRKIAAEQSNANVLLDSNGGAIIPAMDIGRTIRLREYGTLVYKDGVCVSACALIWVAGERRIIFEGGRVGFHASYRDVDGSLIETGMGNALVGHYLSQLGLGQKSVMFATAAPPDKVLWLDTNTASLSAIEYTTIPDGEQPASSGLPSSQQTRTEPARIAVAPARSQPQVGINSGPPPETYERWIAATNETIRNVESFARGLRQKGYQAEIDTSDPDSPSIITGIGGTKFSLSFSSCSKMNCDYIQIMSFWNQVKPQKSQDVIKAWSNDENFSSAMLIPNNDMVAVYHYIVLGSDGITMQNLIENIEYFARDFERIGRLLVEAK